MKSVIVIPTIRNLNFFREWQEFNDPENVEIIVCEDRDEITLEAEWPNITIYSRQEIKKELGKDSWIISFESAAIRSFGFWKAWQKKPDMVCTIDDDCFSEREDYFLKEHWQALNQKATLDWVKTASIFTRGFPYLIRDKNEVVLNHGLWSNIPDLDAPTQLLNPDLRLEPCRESHVVPRYNFFPMSGMNLAFKPSITPLMYFGLQGRGWEYDRFDDINCGIFTKKILDHIGLAVMSGKPSVEHIRQSNVFTNLVKEASGISFNEQLWDEVKYINLEKFKIKDCYNELIDKLPELNDYMKKLKKAMKIWVRLFK